MHLNSLFFPLNCLSFIFCFILLLANLSYLAIPVTYPFLKTVFVFLLAILNVFNLLFSDFSDTPLPACPTL